MKRGWPETPSEATATIVQTAHGPVGVVDEGPRDAACLLLIHGVPGTVRDFRWLAPTLTDHVRVVRFDMPGFGTTHLSSGLGFDVVDRANFVAGVIEALQLRDVTVVGHSMGGVVAAGVATHHRSLVRGVGLWACPGLRPHLKYRLSFPTTLSAGMRLPAIGPALTRLVTHGFIAQGFPAGMGGANMQIVMDYAAGLDFPAHRRRVLSLDVPTMVAYCDDDHLVETEICVELASACPPGPRSVYPTGGHNLQKTRALQLGEALLGWLAPSAAGRKQPTVSA